VWIGVDVLAEPVAKVAETYGAVVALAHPGWLESLVTIAVAIALGWLGAAISVRRHLAEI
jgi:cell division transport system permease protein